MSNYKRLGLYGFSASVLFGATFYFAGFTEENHSVKLENLTRSDPANGTIFRQLSASLAGEDEIPGEEGFAAFLRSQERIMAELAALNSRIANFESRIGDIEKKSPPEQPSEQVLSTEAHELKEAYALAEEDFYAQPVDPQWDAEMTMSLSNMESIIGEYSKDLVNISFQECRSNACRVEFTYSEDAPPLDPAMMAARGASRMFFDTSFEDGMGKTVVIYQR